MSASTQDFEPGLDPTGYLSISGAELLQMVLAATPYSDKGQIVVTSDVAGVADVPDATTTTKWKRYLWKRITASAVIVYVWNENGATDFSGAGFQKWYGLNTAAIASGSITNAMLAGAITADKITSLDWSQLTSVPNVLISTTTFAGDVSGNYNALAIGNEKVTAAMISPLVGAKLVQRVYVVETSYESTTAVIPVDDTIPQITEGEEYTTVILTPKATTNLLRITFKATFLHSDADVNGIVALFHGATANAIAASGASSPVANRFFTVNLEWIGLVSTLQATLDAITFRIRWGTPSGTLYVNGSTSARLFGGVMSSVLCVEEYRS